MDVWNLVNISPKTGIRIMFIHVFKFSHGVCRSFHKDLTVLKIFVTVRIYTSCESPHLHVIVRLCADCWQCKTLHNRKKIIYLVFEQLITAIKTAILIIRIYTSWESPPHLRVIVKLCADCWQCKTYHNRKQKDNNLSCYRSTYHSY